jgi:peroxiredoxin Q/BCP
MADPEVPLSVGDPAPPFHLPAVVDGAAQIWVTVPADLARGPILLVFYQDDGMPICTRELKVIAQEHATLQAAGIQVFGINTNGLGSHAKFHERDHFPFPLISDFHGEAVRSYGFWDAGERRSRRGMVVLAEDGTVAYIQPHFNPGNVNAIVGLFEALGLV